MMMVQKPMVMERCFNMDIQNLIKLIKALMSTVEALNIIESCNIFSVEDGKTLDYPAPALIQAIMALKYQITAANAGEVLK